MNIISCTICTRGKIEAQARKIQKLLDDPGDLWDRNATHWTHIFIGLQVDGVLATKSVRDWACTCVYTDNQDLRNMLSRLGLRRLII